MALAAAWSRGVRDLHLEINGAVEHPAPALSEEAGAQEGPKGGKRAERRAAAAEKEKSGKGPGKGAAGGGANGQEK